MAEHENTIKVETRKAVHPAVPGVRGPITKYGAVCFHKNEHRPGETVRFDCETETASKELAQAIAKYAYKCSLV